MAQKPDPIPHTGTAVDERGDVNSPRRHRGGLDHIFLQVSISTFGDV